MTDGGPLRVAVIGAGRIAGAFAEPGGGGCATHAEVICSTARFELAAVCDVEPARCTSFAERWDVPIRVTSVQSLLSQGPFDVIVVAAPDSKHAAIAGEILETAAPRAIIMEKPLCMNERELSGLSSQLGRVPRCRLVVNHSRRFDPGHQAVRELIARNDLGRPVSIRWVYYRGWLHNGIHVVDTLRMLLGGTFRPIAARVAAGVRPDDACLDVEFESSAVPEAKIRIESHSDETFQLFEGEIRFENGRVRLLDFGAKILVDRVRCNMHGDRELKETRPISVAADADPPMVALYRAMTRFLCDGEEDAISPVGFGEAAESMRILFDAERKSMTE